MGRIRWGNPELRLGRHYEGILGRSSKITPAWGNPENETLLKFGEKSLEELWGGISEGIFEETQGGPRRVQENVPKKTSKFLKEFLRECRTKKSLKESREKSGEDGWNPGRNICVEAWKKLRDESWKDFLNESRLKGSWKEIAVGILGEISGRTLGESLKQYLQKPREVSWKDFIKNYEKRSRWNFQRNNGRSPWGNFGRNSWKNEKVEKFLHEI